MATSLAKILELGEHLNKFHPSAVKHYREFLDDISKDVPLDAITENDVKAFLSDSDYSYYQYSIKRLNEWFEKCLLTNKESTLSVYPDSFPVWGTFGFKDLLRKVYREKIYQKKLKEAEAEAQFQAYLDFQRKERERAAAKAEHKDFVDKIVHSTDSFKARLSTQKEPGFNNYPGWLQPYKPSLWCKLSFPPDGWLSVEMIVKIAYEKSLLFEACQDHVNYKLTYGAWYVPSVRYEVIVPPPSPHSKGHPAKPGTGVSCLCWQMVTYILSTAEFWLDKGIIVDERYDYRWEVRCIPENLGKLYGGPELWCHQPAFITPLNLLAKVAWGKELPGVEAISRNSPWTVFRVEGFPDEVVLHDDFKAFIRDMAKKQPLDKGLLSRKMCDKETAELIKNKLEKLQEPEAPVALPQKSAEPEKVGGAHLTEAVVDKLTELGWSQDEAADAINSVTFPATSTVEEIVKLVLSQ